MEKGAVVGGALIAVSLVIAIALNSLASPRVARIDAPAMQLDNGSRMSIAAGATSDSASSAAYGKQAENTSSNDPGTVPATQAPSAETTR
jgi:hypothetical protein